MNIHERDGSIGYPMRFGEQFRYFAPYERSLGVVALVRKDGFTYARVGLGYAVPEDRGVITIGSHNIFTMWNADTGLIRNIQIFPMVKEPVRGLQMLSLSFETMEPFLSVQQEIEENTHSDVEHGLLYDGQPETGVMMYYDHVATIASKFIAAPRIWLTRVGLQDRMVIESQTGMVEWVRFRKALDLEHILRLFGKPDSRNEQWRQVVADEVHKLRYQVIESNGF